LARERKPIVDENGEAIAILKTCSPEPSAKVLQAIRGLHAEPKACSSCGGMMTPMLWNSRVDIYLCNDSGCPAFRNPQGTPTPPSWEDDYL